MNTSQHNSRRKLRLPAPPNSAELALRQGDPPNIATGQLAQRPAGEPAARPGWMPGGETWNLLPEGIQRFVRTILVPAYQRLVVEESNDMERSMGLTLVGLMWVELWRQRDVDVALLESLDPLTAFTNADAAVQKFLNVVAAKCQTTALLSKLQCVRISWAASGEALAGPR